MKQTAVEYLVEQLSMDQHPDDIVKIIAKAKEIEKEQIIDALKYGDLNDETAEWYYNEIYVK